MSEVGGASVGGHLDLPSCVVLITSLVLDTQPSSNLSHPASFVQLFLVIDKC